MSVNLLELLQSAIGNELVNQGSKFLGESESNVKAGVAAMLPNLLGAIMHQGSTAGGAIKLLDLINSPAVNGNLPNYSLDGLFSGGPETSSLINTGTSLLASLFGNKVDGLVDAIAGVAGLRGESANSLLAMAAPFVLGLLKQQVSKGNLNAGGLMSLLGAQKDHLSGSLSDHIFAALGLGSVASALGSIGWSVADAAKDAANMTGRAVDKSIDSPTAGGGFMKWLPWIAAVLIASALLNTCTKKAPEFAGTTGEAAKNAAGVVAEAIPAGWGALSGMVDGKPSLKVYFNTGKTEISPEFAERAKDLVAYVTANPGTKLAVSGYNDTTGDKAANEVLSKNRAMAVAAALEQAGVAKDAIILQKPADTDGTGTKAEARRVEVSIIK